MPLLGPTMEGRNQVFQRLKPPCVALSQAALALNGPSADVQLLADRLESVKSELSAIVRKPHALDGKLADYVFFPLSQVLKASQRVSIRCLELAFQSLAILIERGWRASIQDQLAAQVLILCTLMAEKKPKGLASVDSTGELQASALWCLHHLFSALGEATEARNKLNSEANFPQLGQTITTILDAVLEAVSVDGQIAATNALQTLVKAATSRQAQAAFLPGITSTLTKVLTPHTAHRRNHVVLVGSLDVLSALFVNTLSDSTMVLSNPESSMSTGPASLIGGRWLETAATQLKPALTAIIRLKDHSRLDVREALAQLCFVILKDCWGTLENCTSPALETILLLASEQEGDAIKFRIEALVATEPAVSALAQATLHNWLQSLTTEMQAADDHAKAQRIQQLCIVYDIIARSGANMSIIDGLTSSVTRDSTAVLLRNPKAKQQGNAITQIQSLDLSTLGRLHKSVEFETAMISSKGSQQVLDAVKRLLETVQASSTSVTFAADLARSLHQTQDDMQLATFWLLLNTTELALRRQDEVEAFLALDFPASNAYAGYLDELYSFALDILTKESDTFSDPRFRVLALRTLALRARQAGAEFRFELVDALYPVLHALATPNEQLQHDSIVALNIFTDACGYSSVKDLVVENVDYLTNSITLKLNAFDVSPQAPQVLLMMIRLAGSSLLPYLEDTIESIFAALEDFHGYPLLVELLFRVLSVVADEGIKAPQLAIAEGSSAELQQVLSPEQQTSILHLAAQLRENRMEEAFRHPSTGRVSESHPKQPWKHVGTQADTQPATSNELSSEDEDEVEDENEPLEDIELPPPVPKTYNLLLKISDLTQHFLPSASTSLRSSLLELIKTTIPAIARHQNSFLPLVNTLWPEIVSRLDDQEPQIIANALEVIGLLCEHAGDFMRNRILQLWPRLAEIWRNVTRDIVQVRSSKPFSEAAVNQDLLADGNVRLRQAIGRMRSSPADYTDTSTRLLWSSLVNAITTAVQYVGLPPDIFDRALEMMEPVLDNEKVRNAFERENSDAVWLLQRRDGTIHLPKVPTCPPGFSYILATAPS